MQTGTGRRWLGYAAAIALTSAMILPQPAAADAGGHEERRRPREDDPDPARDTEQGGGDHDSDTTSHDHGSGHHSHGTLAIPEGQPVPSVTLTVHDDALTGWNLELTLENFTLAPEQVNQASNTTEGHAHLYINGEKLTRLYGPWYYLGSLPSGEHEVRVELNANGHELLMHNGEAIADTVILDVP